MASRGGAPSLSSGSIWATSLTNRMTTTELIGYSPHTRFLARRVQTILHEWSANQNYSNRLDRTIYFRLANCSLPVCLRTIPA
jgi:hypothetical protein